MQNTKTYEELQFENQLLLEILDRIHEAVYVTNDQDKILVFNEGMEKIEGLKKSDILGKHEVQVYDFMKAYDYHESITQRVKKSGKPLMDKAITYNLPDGRLINLILDAYPFYYNNQLSAVYAIGRNADHIGEFIARTMEATNHLNRQNNPTGKAKYFLNDIVGKSRGMQESVKLARKAAVRPSPILIYGKTGTGKELFAQGIHNASMFAGGPFVPVNCAAIPETLLEAILFGTTKGAYTGAVDMPGLFEQAEKGSIFLDEVNSMPQPLQAKLLRVLQDKVVRRLGGKQDLTVDCRIISACNEDPFEQNAIRKDFLYRISTVIINIPPLQDRQEDIRELSQFFVDKYNRQFALFVRKISPELSRAFDQYAWPGNVRELENVIETAMNMVDSKVPQLETKHLPLYLRLRLNITTTDAAPNYAATAPDPDNPDGQSSKFKDELWNFEKNLIADTLRKHNGNVTKAANDLGMWRQNLHYRIKRFGLHEADSDEFSE